MRLGLQPVNIGLLFCANAVYPPGGSNLESAAVSRIPVSKKAKELTKGTGERTK